MIELPSPELLQNKIIIKAKKFVWLNESTASATTTPNNKEKERAKIAEEESKATSKKDNTESEGRKVIEPAALGHEEQSSQMNSLENSSSVVSPASQNVFLLLNQTLFGDIVYYRAYFLSIVLWVSCGQ